jgi:hypothetical protein
MPGPIVEQGFANANLRGSRDGPSRTMPCEKISRAATSSFPVPHTPLARAFLLVLAIAGIAGLTFHGPIAQWAAYHDFADQRSFCGVPNFMDSSSNIVFALAGILVFRDLPKYPAPHRFLFIAMGVSLFGLFAGSTYYHLAPSDARLLWDRLPIASFFALLFVQILLELGIFAQTARNQALAIFYWLASCASVFVWSWTGDLRAYGFFQFFPLVSLLALAPFCFFSGEPKRAALLLVLIVGYGLAKVFETFDFQTMSLTGGLISGHTLKHLFSGATVLAYFIAYGAFEKKRAALPGSAAKPAY